MDGGVERALCHDVGWIMEKAFNQRSFSSYGCFDMSTNVVSIINLRSDVTPHSVDPLLEQKTRCKDKKKENPYTKQLSEDIWQSVALHVVTLYRLNSTRLASQSQSLSEFNDSLTLAAC